MEDRLPRERAKEKSCDLSIQQTLSYSSLFKYPMSFYQLSMFLISRKEYDFQFFIKSLRRLVKKKHIKAIRAKFFLSGIRPVSWELRDKYSEELVKDSYRYLTLLKAVPWIKLVAITGSVAANNAVKDDDIDVFIITDKSRLWLSRFFVYLILKNINKYAQGGEGNRKFCCNLMVDDSATRWPKNKQNIFVAREILGMVPIFDKDNEYFKFIHENQWALDFYKQYKINFPNKFNKSKRNHSKFVNMLEKAAKSMQNKHMKGKITTEIVNKDFIHFNKNDHSESIITEYNNLIKTLN
ncbi:hypothetical protein A2V49_00505 [candidate division WWE3 bacterium RBG_19FT_COMBO_34_6]|uniref:Polymerase nucleotidyl transferase domain-containing protein n=1 Tax=candidate division WWE3 bacterium RBG_19FT_COMBO_34_6 TaxID=1802612 RepID=A0A1F4UNN5_UNCKA|nr:MAG: hypothetical protein A2V49_00505 [candidate division WWE3 bacterium RBG_19FT_COMBO_34_6]